MAQKDRYHDAVNHTCDKTSLVKCLQTFSSKCCQKLFVKKETLQKLLCVKASVYESVCVCV